jgi:hypothetical protein
MESASASPVELNSFEIRDAKRPKALPYGRGDSDEAGEEKEEGVGAVIVQGTVRVCLVLQHVVDPVEGRAELFPATIHVEERQHVDANDGVCRSNVISRKNGAMTGTHQFGGGCGQSKW